MEHETDRDILADRARACLLGGAIGDALGAAVEFLTLKQIRARFGPAGITGYETAYGRRGAITDDTQMTLFTVEGLIRADNRGRERGICHMPRVVLHAYWRWLLTQGQQPAGEAFESNRSWILTGWLFDEPVLHSRRAPGNTCLSALRSGRHGTPDEAINDSKGCGGIMRIAPVGLGCREPFRDGMEIAALTHGHPSGYLAAGAFALIVSRLLHGASLSAAIDAALGELRRYDGHEETTTAVKRAREATANGQSTPEAVQALGAGWVAEEALAIALYSALTAPDFRTGVLLAANHGGDSDSTASLTAQLLAVQEGMTAIPPEWLDGLEARAIVERLADDLNRHFIAPPPAPSPPAGWSPMQSWPPPDDLDRYPPN